MAGLKEEILQEWSQENIKKNMPLKFVKLKKSTCAAVPEHLKIPGRH